MQNIDGRVSENNRQNTMEPLHVSELNLVFLSAASEGDFRFKCDCLSVNYAICQNIVTELPFASLKLKHF